jgi:hypothetical protein
MKKIKKDAQNSLRYSEYSSEKEEKSITAGNIWKMNR